MKQTSILCRTLSVLAAGLVLAASAGAEPPLRAARLGDFDGSVSFSPAGHPDWVRAAVNRPLTTGDRLWTAGRSRAEVQIGGAAMRIGPLSSVTLLRLDNRLVQLQLTQGVLRLRVRSLGPRQYFEIATPNLALTVRRPGDYRIEVDPNENATTVLVRSGEAEVYGEGRSYRVDTRRSYRFYDTGLDDYDVVTVRRDDDFDRWSRDRDRFVERSISARYVSSDVVGYADLDAHGSWRSATGYGYVWTPSRVPAGWSPYRDGHWAWVDPWGWTWIDDTRWGYAVSHYGRWAHLDGTWVWVPGPRRERAVYAPALVAFIGGSNFQISISGGSTGAVGWFPLAPREVYQPSYAVSRAYFDSINRSNAVIAPQVITQVYNTTVVNNNTTVIVNNNTGAGGVPVGYANRQVSGAVVAVPTQAFVQSQPVARATVQVGRDVAVSAPVARVASVAPVTQSVQGGREAAAEPPVREQAVVARTQPPPPPVAFAAQSKQLAAAPGRPIDDAARAQLKPAAEEAAKAPKVSVVASAPAPAATALPPRAPAVSDRAARRAGSAPAAEPAAPAAPSAAAQNADAAKAEPARAEATKAATAKEQAAKAEEAKAETRKGQAAKAEAARADAVKAEAAKAQAARAEEAKAEAAKSEANKAAAAKAQADKAEQARADAAKDQAAKAEGARAEAANAQDRKGRAAKAEEARAEAAKAQAAKAEEAKAEAAKAEAAKAEASKAAAAKAQADKAEQARADAAKAQAAKAEAARADAEKAEAAKAQAAKAEQARADASKAAAQRDEAAAAATATAKADAAAARRDRRGDAASAPGARASGAGAQDDATGDEKRRGRER